jgi:hypothetical protein
MMENFAIGGYWGGGGGSTTVEAVKIISDNSSPGFLAVPAFGLGGSGGWNTNYRGIDISGTYSVAALDLSNMNSSHFDNIKASNTGPGVVYQPPGQGIVTFANYAGFNPAMTFARISTSGDFAPYKGKRLIISDAAFRPFEGGTSQIGRPLLGGGGFYQVEARFNGSIWVMGG